MTKGNRFKIAICIPSFNEADVIANTVRSVDAGLAEWFGPNRCVIVNADNLSEDGTKDVFLTTPAHCKKHYLPSQTHGGKGSNVLNFLHWCSASEIEYAATIDADIRTINKEWVPALLLPLVRNKADFVCPLYLRSRFEGNTTNHFALPVVYAFFGKLIRQPIGGEFGFNTKAMNYFLKQDVYLETLGYGIDIFLTIHTLGSSRLKVAQAVLGQKLHKPSFAKMLPMFKQVFSSACFSLKQYRPKRRPDSGWEDDISGGISAGTEFRHKEKVAELRLWATTQTVLRAAEYVSVVGPELAESLKRAHDVVNAVLWSKLLATFISESCRPDSGVDAVRRIAELAAPPFALRAATCMLESETLEPQRIEENLRRQAELIRSELTARLQL